MLLQQLENLLGGENSPSSSRPAHLDIHLSRDEVERVGVVAIGLVELLEERGGRVRARGLSLGLILLALTLLVTRGSLTGGGRGTEGLSPSSSSLL